LIVGKAVSDAHFIGLDVGRETSAKSVQDAADVGWSGYVASSARAASGQAMTLPNSSRNLPPPYDHSIRAQGVPVTGLCRRRLR